MFKLRFSPISNRIFLVDAIKQHFNSIKPRIARGLDMNSEFLVYKRPSQSVQLVIKITKLFLISLVLTNRFQIFNFLSVYSVFLRESNLFLCRSRKILCQLLFLNFTEGQKGKKNKCHFNFSLTKMNSFQSNS